MKIILLLLALISLTAGHGWRRTTNNFGDYCVVANRKAGSISLVNPRTLRSHNIRLPNDAEPMYFVCLYRRFNNRPFELWVGDRKNNRLVVLKLIGSRVIYDGYVPTPKGLFHSMLSQRFEERRPKSFTTCDIDNVTVVHDVRSRREVCKMHRPRRVAQLGGKPHDVTSDGRFAYVTYIGASDGNGYVASYVARNCRLVRFIKTPKDPHVAIRPGTRLYIAAQGGKVLTRTVPKLNAVSETSMSTPHGIIISFDNRFVYVTNIGDGGKNAVVVFRAKNGRRLWWCPTVNTSFPTPHNPMTSFDGRKLYITHTIAGKNVNSEWTINIRTGCVMPDTERIFRTGDTPFGVGLIPPSFPSFRSFSSF